MGIKYANSIASSAHPVNADDREKRKNPPAVAAEGRAVQDQSMRVTLRSSLTMTVTERASLLLVAVL